MNLLKNLNPESISHAHEKRECRPCAAEAIADTGLKKIGRPHVRLTLSSAALFTLARMPFGQPRRDRTHFGDGAAVTRWYAPGMDSTVVAWMYPSGTQHAFEIGVYAWNMRWNELPIP